jgi:hypothetical protein
MKKVSEKLKNELLLTDKVLRTTLVQARELAMQI